MLKALLKKQFLELNAFYFQNRKTGKNRSKSGSVGMIILFIFLFFFLGVTFYGTFSLLADSLIPSGFAWLYFCMTGMFAIALGTLGSVFNTYAGLYHAKDNDLLLSMPIPPSKILFVRITGVYAMSLLYSSLMWIPAIIKYFVSASPTVLSVIFCILQTFILTLFVTVLTCVLGWVVALISAKVKNKSFVTVLASLLFIGIYYFIYFRINIFLQSIAENASAIGATIKSWFYPFYLMGVASTGKVIPMLIVTAITAAFFALTYFVLSRSFIKITTTKTAEKKTVYKSEQVKTSNTKSALLKKEFARFLASPTYMLNCGIGLFISLSLSVVALIKADTIRDFINLFSETMPGIKEMFPIIAACIVCMLFSTNQITAPSVSLEGKTIWVLQSLPVDVKDILAAKRNLHTYLSLPCAIFATVVLGYIIEADITEIVYMIVLTYSFVLFCASFGLFLNLKMPNLTWTNETVPVKQSAAVGISLFSGWILSAAIGGIAYFLSDKIDLTYYNFVCALVLLFATRYLNRWLNTKGAEIFSNL